MFDCHQVKRGRAEFSCVAPDANSVFLVGTFNNWDVRATPMRQGEDGQWAAVLELPPGQYAYKYVVVYEGSLTVWDEQGCGTVSHVQAEGGARRWDRGRRM